MGQVDTDLIADLDVPKSSPAEIVAVALAWIEAGTKEIIADEPVSRVMSSLIQGPSERYGMYLNQQR